MMAASASDKYGPCKGSLKDGVITIWRKDILKKEFSFSVAADLVKTRLRMFLNPNWVLHEIARLGLERANDAWIEGTSDETLRRKRRECWENDDLYGRYSCAQERTIDSAARVIKTLLEKENDNEKH